MYVRIPYAICPIPLNIANILAEMLVPGTEFYVVIRETSPKNGGHIGGKVFPKSILRLLKVEP